MKLYIEELGVSRDALIEKAVERANLYLDSREYESGNELNLMVTTKDDSIGLNGEEYMFYAFSIWREVYKKVPEFLIFLTATSIIEVFFGHYLFSKASADDLLRYSAQRARERGISEGEVALAVAECERYLGNF